MITTTLLHIILKKGLTVFVYCWVQTSSQELDHRFKGPLTTVLLVAVVRAVVVIVAPPDGRYTPFVVALKLSILTLIRGWRKGGKT